MPVAIIDVNDKKSISRKKLPNYHKSLTEKFKELSSTDLVLISFFVFSPLEILFRRKRRIDIDQLDLALYVGIVQ